MLMLVLEKDSLDFVSLIKHKKSEEVGHALEQLRRGGPS